MAKCPRWARQAGKVACDAEQYLEAALLWRLVLEEGLVEDLFCDPVVDSVHDNGFPNYADGGI